LIGFCSTFLSAFLSVFFSAFGYFFGSTITSSYPAVISESLSSLSFLVLVCGSGLACLFVVVFWACGLETFLFVTSVTFPSFLDAIFFSLSFVYATTLLGWG